MTLVKEMTFILFVNIQQCTEEKDNKLLIRKYEELNSGNAINYRGRMVEEECE